MTDGVAEAVDVTLQLPDDDRLPEELALEEAEAVFVMLNVLPLLGSCDGVRAPDSVEDADFVTERVIDCVPLEDFVAEVVRVTDDVPVALTLLPLLGA